MKVDVPRQVPDAVGLPVRITVGLEVGLAVAWANESVGTDVSDEVVRSRSNEESAVKMGRPLMLN